MTVEDKKLKFDVYLELTEDELRIKAESEEEARSIILERISEDPERYLNIDIQEVEPDPYEDFKFIFRNNEGKEYILDYYSTVERTDLYQYSKYFSTKNVPEKIKIKTDESFILKKILEGKDEFWCDEENNYNNNEEVK
jgi:hypothetical protein